MDWLNGKGGQIAGGLPRVVLPSEDCRDEPPYRSPVREDALHASIRRLISLVRRPWNHAVPAHEARWHKEGRSTEGLELLGW